jgi:hypothetical protein
MLLQLNKNLVANVSWRMSHGYSKIKNKLLNSTEHITFSIVRKILEFLLCDSSCSALGRA